MMMLKSDPVNIDISSISSEDLELCFTSFINGLLSSIADADLFDSKDILLAEHPCKTIAFHGNLVSEDVKLSAEFRSAVIIDTENNRVVNILLGQSDNSEYSYFSDYEKIIQSATPIKSEAEKDAFASSDGIRPEFKQVMDSYEEFFNEYIAFMKKYETSDNSFGMLTDYLEFMTQYMETMEELENMDTDDLSSDELLYYTEVMLRINQKLYEMIS